MITASRSLLALLIAAPSVALAQASPSAALWSLVRPRYSGERARETVAFLDQYVRWPGNRGFDASIAHIVERLRAAGYVAESVATARDRLVYRVERYPMTNPAWEPTDASLSIVGDTSPVLQFATNRNMLATNSYATPADGVEAELVDAGAGTAARLDSLDVRGKIVLAESGIGRLFTEAVARRGAAGVLAYSLPAYLQPTRNTTSIQFGGLPRGAPAGSWGILLSHEALTRLRAALGRGPVRVRVSTNVTWTPNAVEQAVVAEVRGSRAPEERFVFSAHVQEPGANDNASGVGAQVEMARVAAQLVKAGRVNPARTITMLWGLEITSTRRYIEQDSVRARGIRWGLSLDMVGEDTEKTGGTFLIEKMPDPSAIWTRGDDKHSEWGGSPITKDRLTPHYFNDFVLQRCLEQARTNGWVVRTNPFEGGSDHTPFLQAKKPGLLFWHFTDQFYHTDRDRLEMVSASELRNVGMSALVSALVLTSASSATARMVIDETERAAIARLAVETTLGAGELARGGDAALQRDIIETWAAWYRDAVGTVSDIEIDGPSPAVRQRIAAAQARLDAALRTSLAGLGKRPGTSD
ncbi:MAG: M28 family peptidase [Gemmatimonadaceae bacterium]|nr:M28 family peptidase [Gemmatimonadaceae bacterium]